MSEGSCVANQNENINIAVKQNYQSCNNDLFITIVNIMENYTSSWLCEWLNVMSKCNCDSSV